jgi:hypothetical protein
MDAAHLDDAIQIDLNGIFHSINAPDQWYGSDAVLDSWHDTLLEEIAARASKQQQPARRSQVTTTEGQVDIVPGRTTGQ